MERERSQSNASSTITTPRLPAGELPIMKRFIARSRSLSTDATVSDPSEKTESSGKQSENQSKAELLTCQVLQKYFLQIFDDCYIYFLTCQSLQFFVGQ